MASIGGIPINSAHSQFDLIKDPVQAFNDTARFVAMTRDVPIVNELATRAEMAAMRQQVNTANTVPINPLNTGFPAPVQPQSLNYTTAGAGIPVQPQQQPIGPGQAPIEGINSRIVKRRERKDGGYKILYEDGTKVICRGDGSYRIKYADGREVRCRADGSYRIKFEDGLRVEYKSNGDYKVRQPDGTVFRYDSDEDRLRLPAQRKEDEDDD